MKPETLVLKKVNTQGLSEIKKFLDIHHKNAILIEDDGLNYWAEMAEDQMSMGNPPSVEIRAMYSATGRPEEFTLSPDCIETQILED